MATYETLRIDRSTPGVVRVVLNRPEVRNAFNETVIRELHEVFASDVGVDGDRVAVLAGEGKAFCAGADLNWMKASVALTREENEADARRMAAMFAAVAACPLPVVARVHGAALGGGAGLLAAADIGIVAADAKVGFTEVRLGIIPAVISPFVLRKVPETHARRYFASGEIFDGAEAARIGLAQKSVAADELDAEIDSVVDQIRAVGPIAVTESKKLIDAVQGVPLEDVSDVTAPWIARLRESAEGQEGMAAFLERRRPSWSGEEDA